LRTIERMMEGERGAVRRLGIPATWSIKGAIDIRRKSVQHPARPRDADKVHARENPRSTYSASLVCGMLLCVGASVYVRIISISACCVRAAAGTVRLMCVSIAELWPPQSPTSQQAYLRPRFVQPRARAPWRLGRLRCQWPQRIPHMPCVYQVYAYASRFRLLIC
jgi:hypothetical protein